MKRRLSCVLIALLLVLSLVLPTPAGAATLDVESDTVTTLSVSSDMVTTVRADWVTMLSEILSAILSALDILGVFFGDSTYTIDDIYSRLNLISSRLSYIQGDTEYIEDILDTLSHGSYNIADMVYYIWQELASGDIANALEVFTEEYSYEWSNGVEWSGNLLWWVARAARSLGYSNGTTVYSAGYMLYTIMQSLSVLSDTYSWTSDSGTTFGGDLLYWVYRIGRSSLYGTDSTTYYTAQLLYYIWQDTSYIDDTYTSAYWDGESESLHLVSLLGRIYSVLGYKVADVLADLYDVFDGTYTVTWTSSDIEWSGDFFWWVTRIARNLAYSTDSSVYTAGTLLYYIYQDTSYLDDTYTSAYWDGESETLHLVTLLGRIYSVLGYYVADRLIYEVDDD